MSLLQRCKICNYPIKPKEKCNTNFEILNTQFACNTKDIAELKAKKTTLRHRISGLETHTSVEEATEPISIRIRRATESSTTPTPDDEDDEVEEEDSSEIDDDGKVYKNPRNSPSTLCPRDEEQATLLVIIERECFSNKLGALLHHAVTVRNCFNSEFNEHWIGRDGPILWPPRSPDLTILDFYLRGRLKQIVYREPLENDEEQLKTRVQNAVKSLSIEEIINSINEFRARIEICAEKGGAIELIFVTSYYKQQSLQDPSNFMIIVALLSKNC
ncbi:hypothetical protein NQ318_001675 [Aromia moschata]|uniref:Uncharacterized protein n=1 Tax=Aromia moschata TaxID=1265417 RepID=A0AAV8XGJ7_9CUCU|nr:hypothetical protein NQ318_001675 [Aromia moschata]